MLTVEVVALRGALASSVAVTLDVLATANRLREARGCTAAFAVNLSGNGRGMFGSGNPPPSRTRPDAVLLPGLGAATEEEITARLRCRDVRRTGEALALALEGGAEVATSCTGTFLLAAVGLLRERRATTSWWLAPLLRRLHPEVRLEADALLVRDGTITTAGAALAQVDVVLDLVARRAGRPLADECARYLLLDVRRSQATYAALAHLAAADEAVARAERWARRHLEAGLTVEEVAASVGLSPRTFARRVVRTTGLSPVRFLQRIRVERAVELLETSRLSVEEVAQRVGYAEPSTLRRLIRQHTGAGPARLRLG